MNSSRRHSRAADSCGECRPSPTGRRSPSTPWCPARGYRRGANGWRLRGSGRPASGHTKLTGSPACAPALGVDTDERTIPHEVGWIDTAVHLDKGCYRGQETVARVHNLGKPPRMLVLVHLDGSVSRRPPASRCWRAGARWAAWGRWSTMSTSAPSRSRCSNAACRRTRALTASSEDAEVAAVIDAGLVPAADGPGAGRAAVNRLRGGHGDPRRTRGKPCQRSARRHGKVLAGQQTHTRSEPPSPRAAPLLREGVPPWAAAGRRRNRPRLPGS